MLVSLNTEFNLPAPPGIRKKVTRTNSIRWQASNSQTRRRERSRRHLSSTQRSSKWTRSCASAGQGPYPCCSICSKGRKSTTPVPRPKTTDASKLKTLRRAWRNKLKKEQRLSMEKPKIVAGFETSRAPARDLTDAARQIQTSSDRHPRSCCREASMWVACVCAEVKDLSFSLRILI